jgi:phosphate-selective porin O/P
MRKLVLVCLIAMFLPIVVYAQGCMEASSDEGVNVVGYLQAQYEYTFQDTDIDSVQSKGFTFNRARMGVVGNIPYDFSYYIMYEFSPNKDGAPYLLDGFITYSRFAPWVNVSVGQFKSPFSLELNTPCQGLHTINRSMVVTQLASPDRDRGIMFTGKYKQYFNYGLALTNGRGREKEEDNLYKALSARFVLSPFEFISIGYGFKGWVNPARDDFGYLNYDADNDERVREAYDLEFNYNNFLIQGEYIKGEDIGSCPVWGG